jgi:hypothetical protein
MIGLAGKISLQGKHENPNVWAAAASKIIERDASRALTLATSAIFRPAYFCSKA